MAIIELRELKRMRAGRSGWAAFVGGVGVVGGFGDGSLGWMRAWDYNRKVEAAFSLNG
jgi:hypothetical protein